MKKKTSDLKYTLDKTDLRIYRKFHIIATDYTFFSSAHKTFSRIDHMTGYKTSLSKLKKTEIIPTLFLTKMARNKKINNRKKMGKFINM